MQDQQVVPVGEWEPEAWEVVRELASGDDGRLVVTEQAVVVKNPR